ncbi:hypothetical protein O181_033215 [Austropuccinia psidii MF-1]|uniref:Uncharacterized protein n=1 Tax=Austropuccinia psidii MF-1 TaxID=1389203 RepID=A0A9Q3D0Y1_9BASI|nr:hypothetical protein [Austropuccinia psidii MF-1]
MKGSRWILAGRDFSLRASTRKAEGESQICLIIFLWRVLCPPTSKSGDELCEKERKKLSSVAWTSAKFRINDRITKFEPQKIFSVRSVLLGVSNRVPLDPVVGTWHSPTLQESEGKASH